VWARTILNPNQESKRKWIALGICLLSAVPALIGWHFGERAWLASSARIDFTVKAIGALIRRNIHSDDRASLANRRA
jgi:hypothetical protein